MSEYKALPGDKQRDNDVIAGYQKRQNVIIEEQNQVEADFIKKNPNSIVSLNAIKVIGGSIPDYAVVAPLFNSLSPDVKNTLAGKEYAKGLEKMKATAICSMAPQFTQNDPDGKPIKLSSFQGKYVLVDFWASWCGQCRTENPNVVKAYNKYHDKGLEILGVSLDDEKGKEAWLEAIKKDGLIWNQVSELKGWMNEAAELYGVKAIPQNVLLDKTGKIIAKNLRGEALNKELEEIFK
jgi:peroxiredoxin